MTLCIGEGVGRGWEEFWKAGNGLSLDLGPGYTGVCFYKVSKPGTYVLCNLLYRRCETRSFQINVLQRKLCEVEILMRFESLWMKHVIF